MGTVAVVGSGAAGVLTAEALRIEGWSGGIVVVGEEPEHPYDRPPLSKQVLAGTWDADRATLVPEHRWSAIDAEFRLGRRAVALDARARRLTLDDGRQERYDHVVIASGVRPRPVPGWDLPGVHTLRTLADAVALRGDLLRARRLLVVGGGFLGLETAATARGLGVDVTVVEPVAAPLANRLGALVAGRLVERHRTEGTDVRAGVGVRSLEVVAGGLRATLTDGARVDADVVLVAVGCVPNVEWLRDSGLDLDDGVVCDEYCRAADGVWAVGDVARWRHPRHGGLVRVEHRSHATDSAAVVARSICGEPTVYDPVPFFWTDHFDVKIQLAGRVPVGADLELHDEPDERGRFTGVFRDSGATVGVLAWNHPARFTRLRRDLLAATPA